MVCPFNKTLLEADRKEVGMNEWIFGRISWEQMDENSTGALHFKEMCN